MLPWSLRGNGLDGYRTQSRQYSVSPPPTPPLALSLNDSPAGLGDNWTTHCTASYSIDGTYPKYTVLKRHLRQTAMRKTEYNG